MDPPPPVTLVDEDDAVRGWGRPSVVVPTFAVIALLGGVFPSMTLSAGLYIFAVGGVLFWLGMTGLAGRRPAPVRLPSGAVWWLVPLLLLGLVELFAFLKHADHPYPTLSLLADPVLERYPARAACYFGWLTAFWGLIRR